ncbi:nucleoside deaminase [Beijerinckia sp. L45]|uniref:nucleoside deaminase n=1 Tax=Beijerinckia sp. L45 TaxID=1641855 RepID=UPI00131BA803|nr:nucleoside deaminase [Beijerinckia sp. L45]
MAAQMDFMRRAIDLARHAVDTGSGGPFGCVIVKDGVIVAEGFNQVRATQDPTAHGEMVGLRAAAAALGTADLSGCEIYNISVPCPMCLAALYWAKIDKVFYCCLPEDADAAGYDNVTIARHLQKPIEAQPIRSERIEALYDDALAVYRHAVAMRRTAANALSPPPPIVGDATIPT